MPARLAMMAILSAAALAGGCGPQRGGADAPPTGVVRNVALTLEVAPIRDDDRPGAQGVHAVATLFQVDPVGAVAARGPLTFAMYEGDLSAAAVRRSEPYRQWRFSADQLQPYMGRYDLGMLGYRVPLRWGDRRPRTNTVTFVCRYDDPQTGTVWSAPSAYLLGQP